MQDRNKMADMKQEDLLECPRCGKPASELRACQPWMPVYTDKAMKDSYRAEVFDTGKPDEIHDNMIIWHQFECS